MMTIKDTIKNQINQLLEKKYGLSDINFQIGYPPSAELGDYSCNVAMLIAKKLKKNPMKVGQEITEAIKQESNKTRKQIFYKIEIIKPGFINFYLSNKWLASQLGTILKLGEKYGKSNEGRGKIIVIDYSAPNIAKKMHIGHLRSTIIGATIYNLYKFLGYKVVRDNHLGDWGTQFGKLIYEYKTVYGKKIKKNISVDEMEKMYIDFHQKAKKNPELEDKARQELKKLQNKDRFNYRLWQLFCKISIKEFKGIYKILNVDFDTWNGESFYNKMLAGIIKDALNKNIAKKSEGALIIPLEKFNLPVMMIQKSDGAYLYTTTDLATIKYRHKKYKPIKNIYVVANQQSLHFEQLFKISELLGYHDKEKLLHIKFGLILGRDGKKMSTREGKVVDLINLIKQGVQKAEKRILEKNKNLSKNELAEIAEIVAKGAIKYNDLSQNRLTDIVFDWDKMLSFEKESSPYLQYTYVRIKSILKKIKISGGKADYNLLTEEAELKLIKDLVKFPEMIQAAVEEHKPNLTALYLENLAADFHSFYEKISIIKSKGELQKARLGLIKAVALVMESGLQLLGIEAPKRM